MNIQFRNTQKHQNKPKVKNFRKLILHLIFVTKFTAEAENSKANPNYFTIIK